MQTPALAGPLKRVLPFSLQHLHEVSERVILPEKRGEMTDVKRGHCLCNSVTFEYEGPENWSAHCHCESCRRATSSGFTSFMGVANGQWRWTGQPPRTYHSSSKVTRSFCGTCGAQVAYQSTDFPDEIHFYAALLDDPAQYHPTVHVHSGEQVPWITLGDALIRK